jgi:5-methylcytosine-specific restriction endonuclease McrA
MHNSWERLYKHPKWFKKRDIILKRDNYKCTACGSTKNLHVHHTFYYKVHVLPWEYPEDSLLTVCKECHTNWHEYHEIEYKDNPKPKHRHKQEERKKKQPAKRFKTLAAKLAYLDRERDRRKNSVKIKGKWYKL